MKEPLVEAGLRALREEAPSDESRRATLARLGLADEPPSVPPAAGGTARPARAGAARPTRAGTAWLTRAGTVRHAPVGGTVRWLLTGIVLGLIAVLLRRWLF